MFFDQLITPHPHAQHALTLPDCIVNMQAGDRCTVSLATLRNKDLDWVTPRTDAPSIAEFRVALAALSTLRHLSYSITHPSNDSPDIIVSCYIPLTVKRSAYPYATMAVGDTFAVSDMSEPKGANLRVHTSNMGRQLGRKFSVTYSSDDHLYTITRKE